MTDATSQVRSSCGAVFKNVRNQLQHMHDSRLHAPNNNSTTVAYPSPSPTAAKMDVVGMECTCGKLFKSESSLAEHQCTSKAHRSIETFVAGSANGARGKTAVKTSGAAVYHHHPAFV
jgi:uncharacterized C2H2 Zn-finger protein